MDHVVYVEAKGRELDKIVNGSKTMIIRGAMGRKIPYGFVNDGDTLYFVEDDGEEIVQIKATAKKVTNSNKLSAEESLRFFHLYRSQLQLSPEQVQRWARKSYLVLIEIDQVKPVGPFSIDRSSFGITDDWLAVGAINSVRVNDRAFSNHR
jgi:hypothetical protein